VGYNAAATGGSNKGPTNPDYLAQVEERIAAFLKQNPEVSKEDVTVDLVTASGGGLDPHISPRAAEIQIPRIAKVRGLSEDAVRSLVRNYTEEPLLGMLGPSRVNVLRLNIALDKLK
jgi:K+-transporting ATPase ATPase C chain